jgi:hypothetical protein
MYETMQYMSVWELAHRWVEADPMTPIGSPIPLAVQPVLRALSYAVATGKLPATDPIFLEVRERDSENPSHEAMFVSDYNAPLSVSTLDTLLSCTPDRKVLDGIFVDSGDVFYWVTRQNPIPSFPDFIVPQWAWTKENKSTQAEIEDSPSPVRRPAEEMIDRATCQGVAICLWSSEPDMQIARVSNHPVFLKAGGSKYSENTRYKWAREVAPDPVKNRPGRPKNSEKKT